MVTYPDSEPSEPQICYTLYFSFMNSTSFKMLAISLTSSIFMHCLVNEKTKTPLSKSATMGPFSDSSDCEFLFNSSCSGCLFHSFIDSMHTCPTLSIAMMKYPDNCNLRGKAHSLRIKSFVAGIPNQGNPQHLSGPMP